MADALKRLKPDVILLQECFRTENAHPKWSTATELAKTLGMKATLFPSRTKTRVHQGVPVMSSTGLASLSTRAPTDILRVTLPSSEAGGARTALFISLPFEGQLVTIGNIHLSHIRNEHGFRIRQWNTAIDEVGKKWNPPHMLIGGDFNLDLDAYGAELTQHKDWWIRDTFIVGGGQPGTATFPIHKPLPYKARRIDGLMSFHPRKSRLGSVVCNARVIGTPLCCDSTMPFSDHAIVCVDWTPDRALGDP